MKFKIYIAITVLSVLLVCADLFAADNEAVADNAGKPSDEKWFLVNSGFFNIYVHPDVNIKSIATRLSRRGLFQAGVYDPNPASAPTQRMAYMVDRLLKRVKEVLDMWPENTGMTLRIYKNREALNEEYYKVFGNRPGYKAFYIFKYDTIYTSEEDISDSVLAHEMGHAVVDHYFSKIPPAKISELMAQYVDLHLED